MTTVIVKISIPKVKIAVLKNLLIFGEKYLPQGIRGVETLFGQIPFEHAVSLPVASLNLNVVDFLSCFFVSVFSSFQMAD